MRRHRPALVLFLGLFIVPVVMPWRGGESSLVEGRVTDAKGPVAGARVRWQGDASFVESDSDGRFRLRGRPGASRHVTVSKAGYRIAAVIPRTGLAEICMQPLPSGDNEEYAWLSPHADVRQSGSCGNCHAEIHREWAQSAHARSARNPKLLQLITDPDGKSPPGWDLSREHPLGVGVCAACHAPTLDSDDLHRARGVAADGVHCDYCHKIADAPTDKLGVRFGRDGLVLLRPRENEQLSYGPLEDAVRTGESFGYLPVYKESRICASCHEGTIFGVNVYGTYTEWLESPAKAQGVQCQACHMASTGKLTNIAPGKGGIERGPATLASHNFPGSQAELLRRCLSAEVQRRKTQGGLRVDVTVRADQVGHRVPTGFIDRHLLLIVQAFDAAGKTLPLSAGPRLGPAAGNQAGQPGFLYGRLRTGEAGDDPLPFWIPGADLRDTRLHAGKPDEQSFVFPGGAAHIEVRLLYRRFWHQVASARGWADNDVLVLKKTLTP
jgi:hypothetical protein